MNYWWVVASENTSNGGWHWDSFFSQKFSRGEVYSWGGAEWIKSTVSHKRIKDMRKGDIVAAHQGREGILGLIFLASNGYCSEIDDQYDIFDLKPKSFVYFDNPISYKFIKELPEAEKNFEFVKFQQNTVFRITAVGFEMLINLAAELNPDQGVEIERFLARGGIDRDILKQSDLTALSKSELPKRVKSEITRIIRDTAKTKSLKYLYQFRCQVCKETIEIAPNKFYAEVHHIRPLGGGHAGSDSEDNMIVVCPTHHAYFDFGVPLFLSEKKIQIGGANFKLKSKHRINESNIDYHNREIFGSNL